MAEGLHLFGYGPSVYTRIVRMGLIECRLTAAYTEVNPFADTPDPTLAQITPFQRVPVLQHARITLTETAAILRYLDQISTGTSLVPQDAAAAAQMAQVIAIVDFYGYVPMVRDVFARGFYLAHLGEAADASRVAQGLHAAVPVLQALDAIARDGCVLNAKAFTLADIHLAPMLEYFTKVPEAARVLGQYAALSSWWGVARRRASLIATDSLTHQ